MTRIHAGLLTVATVLLAAACSSSDGGNVNGTLRANQVTMFEGGRWTDSRCTEGAGAANCCFSNGPFCLDFPDYLLSDVRVKGQRVAVLMTANNGHMLLLSDDLGASWRRVVIGSVGGIATFQPSALHLAGNDVYLMVQTHEEGPLGGRMVVHPWKVDLDKGGTTEVTLQGTTWLYARPHAFSADDGTASGATFLPVDARDPNAKCRVNFEAWKPGSPVQLGGTVTSLVGCPESFAPASDDGRFYPVLMVDESFRACLAQYDAVSQSASATCVPWEKWPAHLPAGTQPIFAAQAGKRAWRYEVFSEDDAAWAVTPTSADWVSLGHGTPLQNRRSSGRQPFAGMVPLKESSGATRLARINADGTADDVLLPTSPCTGDAPSCFDPKSALTFHGEVGDIEWIEPLGNDEYLVFYVHDLGPGINQYAPIFTVSREKATYRRITPLAKPLDPALRNAQPPGAAEKWCIKRAACGDKSVNVTFCAVDLMQWNVALRPGFAAAMAAAETADCDSLIVKKPEMFDCLLRGGTLKALDPSGVIVSCDFGVQTDRVACRTCAGDVYVDCQGMDVHRVPINCAASGTQKCGAAGCYADPPCTGSTGRHCVGDVARSCDADVGSIYRCDLMNMSCDTTKKDEIYTPCIGRTTGAPEPGVPPQRCIGNVLVWNAGGPKAVDCTTLGWSGCDVDHCVK